MPTDQDKQGLMCHEHSPDRNHQFQSAACSRAAQLWADQPKHFLYCAVYIFSHNQCVNNAVFKRSGWRSNRRGVHTRWSTTYHHDNSNVWGHRRHGCILVVSEYSVESASFTARGALIYNASQNNASVAILDFGSDKVCNSSFTIQFPAVTNTNAILRIA